MVVTEREIHLHGQRMRFLEAGVRDGRPVVVLVHGLAGSSQTWRPLLELLGAEAYVIAPDLLGHGGSAKPASGDYSLGSYAAGVRDLLVALGLHRATVVGHSFGGGVAMQFAYQYPEFAERLVLIASGGLGPEVSVALRAASLPGAAAVLRVTALTPRWVGRLVQRIVRVGTTVSGADVEELGAALGSLRDPGARCAFVHTIRSALHWSGQRLDGTPRLYLLAAVPVLFVAGRGDRVIPAAHTVAAHRSLPSSHLELLDTGHFPHLEQAEHTARVLCRFLADTTPACSDLRSLRARLLGAGLGAGLAADLAADLAAGPGGAGEPPESVVLRGATGSSSR